MIEVHELSKTFGEVVAVDGLSFAAEAGSLFGLLGPNGAGKSTTIACISGLLRPTSGRVTILGRDVVTDGREARKILGVVPQELALYGDLNAENNLSYWGAAYGLSGKRLRRRVDAVLELTGLLDRAKEPVKNFSGGMQRRLNFGCGIVHEPRVLLLDEPTVGVDPQSRVRLLDLVRELVSQGTCVLYTTHYMEEAQALCDRIGIVDHGKLLALGTLDELRGMIGGRDVLRLTGKFDSGSARAALGSIERAEVIHADATSLMVAIEDASRRLPTIFRILSDAGAEVHETTLNQPTLESLFIKLTGRELRE
jgi:linearmycin/streptolysin S transport system ATP-binding protein